MSMLNRRQFVQTGSLLAAGILAGCGSNADSGDAAATDAAAADASEYTLVNEGKLTCISNLYFPPFESMDEKTGDPVGFDIDMSYNGIDAETVKQFHDRGLLVGLWTANTREALDFCISMNVDFIESDFFASEAGE